MGSTPSRGSEGRMSFGPYRIHPHENARSSRTRTQPSVDEDQVSKLDKAQRKAAGHCCMLLFHTMHSVASELQRLGVPRDKWKVGTWHGAGEGLSERERAFVSKLSSDILEDADKLRRLGHIFLKVDNEEMQPQWRKGMRKRRRR